MRQQEQQWLLALYVLAQFTLSYSFILCFDPIRGIRVPHQSDSSHTSHLRCLGKSNDVIDQNQFDNGTDGTYSADCCDEIEYGGLHHCGVLVCDAEKAKQFYIDVFGFTDESYMRPTTLPYPGAFLKCGSNQIHLMQLANPDAGSSRPSYVGRDRHVAISVRGIDSLSRRLARHGIKFSLSSSGRRALFCRDLDENGYEFVEVVDM